MNFLVNKFRKNTMKDLEINYNIIKENMFYGQHLFQIGSWTYDIRSNEYFLSDAIYHILGCEPEDFHGQIENYIPYIHPDDLEEIKPTLLNALLGEEYDLEYRIITPRGLEKYVHEKTKVLLDENKQPLKIVGVLQDITNRKLIENNLIEIGENLNQIQRVAGVGSWKYDRIKDELFWSEEIYRIFGIEPTEFQRSYHRLFQLLHPEDGRHLETAVSKCLEGKSFRLEYRIPQRDHSIKYVLSHGEPLIDKEGRVIGIVGTLQDITERKLLEIQLAESNKNLSAAQALSHTGSWSLDIINNRSIWSEECYRIYGITPEQYDGTYEGFLKYVYPEDIPIIQSLLEDPPTEPFDMNYRIKRRDGSIRHIYQRVVYDFDAHGNPTNIHGTIQDISSEIQLKNEIHDKEEEIDATHKRFQRMIQKSSDVFEIITPDGTIQYMSPAAEKVIGYRPEERIGKKVFAYYGGTELDKLNRMMEFVLKHPANEIHGDLVFRNKEGKDLHLEVHMQNFVGDPSIEGIIVNFRDITRRINIEKRMAYLSTHDDLTGLPNHKYFNKKLRLQCKHAEETDTQFALMMMDVEGLKYVNYSFGYELGKKLIIEIVKRLRTTLGEEIFISRYSDDHFAIMVQGSEAKEYGNLARLLMKSFLTPFHIDKYNIDLSVNIGIGIYPRDAQGSILLRKQSLIALIRAKKEGKNTYKFYSSDLDMQNYKEFILRSDLHNAIENHQLQVYYQPILRLKTNEIIAVEALIRWEHPDWGIINPNEFIYIAEEIGFIIDIGKWMLQEVCQNYLQWIQKGYPPIKVSINYSVIQMFENNFIENIIETIKDFGLDPHFLIMEVTESVLMKNSDKAISDIKQLQSFGIQIAIDDFGSDYSSLAYLRSFNIDIIKLDASFIGEMETDHASYVITKSMINMAKELKIKIVAEGIETWDQLSLLRELNCYSGQGFIYSMPVESKDFEAILSKGKCKPALIAFDATKYRDRRKYFRIQFHQCLEASSTIRELNGKRIRIGDTKVLIQDIGPGGLCFISNLKLPIEKNIIMRFTTHLLGEEIHVQGRLVWAEEKDHLHEYGVEYIIDENQREELVRVFNTLQIKMRKDILFAEGDFIKGSPVSYFN